MAKEQKKFLDQVGVGTLWGKILVELNKKADDSDVEGIDSRLTTAEGKIAALEAGTYDDTAVRGLISDNASDIDALETRMGTAESDIDTVEGKVSTLIGSDENKSVRTIANEELAAQLIPAAADESLDTLQEIAAWIQSHPGDASAMNAAITALQSKLTLGTHEVEGEQVEYANVRAYVENAISALNIGNYALASDLTALAARVTANETAIAGIHEFANESVLDGITAAKVSAWDSALQAADIATGSANGTISVDGSDVAVKGLGTAAYTDATAYDAAGAANEVYDAVIALTTAEIESAIAGATPSGN